MRDADSIVQQREIYGEPLGVIAHRIMERLGLTQGRLAEGLGLSAPMLSQLMSGQRVKIGNPAVLHRLQELSDLADRATEVSLEEVAARIAGIRGEHVTISGRRTDPTATATTLRQAAPSAELLRLAGLTDAPALAELLRTAAEAPGG